MAIDCLRRLYSVPEAILTPYPRRAKEKTSPLLSRDIGGDFFVGAGQILAAHGSSSEVRQLAGSVVQFHDLFRVFADIVSFPNGLL